MPLLPACDQQVSHTQRVTNPKPRAPQEEASVVTGLADPEAAARAVLARPGALTQWVSALRLLLALDRPVQRP